MDPSHASSSSFSEGTNSVPELTDFNQLATFKFLFETFAESYNVWGIISGTEVRPDADPNEPGISVAERRSRSDARSNFDNRSNLAIRLLTRAIKSNIDLVSQLANDSTPNLTRNPAIYYSRICAIALPTSALSVSNVDAVFSTLINDKHEEGNAFFKRWMSVANQAISLGVYKRDNVLKTKFAKALCHNEMSLLATLLGSATVDSQSFGDFCNYAILFYNSATSSRSVADNKNSGKKDTVLIGKFNNFKGRSRGRGRGNTRPDYNNHGRQMTNFTNKSYSSGQSSARNVRGRYSGARGGGGRNNYSTRSPSSNGNNSHIKCFNCNQYGHYADSCRNSESTLSGHKRKADTEA